MKAKDEIKDELDKNIIKRKGIAVKSYRRKEWYNGYIKGLEMAIYLINKETNSSSSDKAVKEVIANETTYQQQEKETDKQFADRVFAEENVKKIVNSANSKKGKEK